MDYGNICNFNYEALGILRCLHPRGFPYPVSECESPAGNSTGKRGRKRKIVAREADEPELEPEVARPMYTLVPWSAPVPQMI